VLSRPVGSRGVPKFLRSDNGSGFVSKALLSWIVVQNISTALIDPGKPWQNGVTESFSGKFRDECLSLEWFRSAGRGEGDHCMAQLSPRTNAASEGIRLKLTVVRRIRAGHPAGRYRLRARGVVWLPSIPANADQFRRSEARRDDLSVLTRF
jgi:transposase InsO family protein